MQFVWPPKEPGAYKDKDPSVSTALQARLQGSPWTYGNDGPNPALRARNRSNFSPYHPSYQPSEHNSSPTKDADRQFDHEYDDTSTSSLSRASSDYDPHQSPDRDVRVRRGSEGWEVRPLSNEEIVARYARSRGLVDGSEDMEIAPLDLDGGDEGEWDADADEAPGTPEPESDFVEVAPAPRYNTYIPETPDSSEDEALGAHVGHYTDI